MNNTSINNILNNNNAINKAPLYDFFTVINCVGVVGNIFIIWFFVKVHFKTFQKMSSYHFLLLQLAVLDLWICVAKIIIGKTLPGSSFESYIDLTIKVFSFQTMFELLLISFLRYQSIVHPFTRKLNKGQCVYFSLTGLVLSSLLWSTWFLMGLYGWDNTLYRTVIDLSTRCSLFLILVIFYYKTSGALNNSVENSQARERNKIALKTLKFLLWLFAVTMTFSKVFNVCLAQVDRSTLSSNGQVAFSYTRAFLLNMPLINSVGNCFVYMKMIPEFRSFILNIFTMKRCRNRRSKDTRQRGQCESRNLECRV